MAVLIVQICSIYKCEGEQLFTTLHLRKKSFHCFLGCFFSWPLRDKQQHLITLHWSQLLPET